eukprot:TRINITY_DN444_c0_g1_i1.p1 TRINITY_DN444_c0_g1~~TRINITY_DN444_c0_g1_i1.p1  ORF type:complete len:236 (+),score=53.17 TRINITY_DN444_c0_g1_i1:35-742(+)
MEETAVLLDGSHEGVINEKTKSSKEKERKSQEQEITALLDKLSGLKDKYNSTLNSFTYFRLFGLRYDGHEINDDKNQELNSLSSDILKTETSIINHLIMSTDSFRASLELSAINKEELLNRGVLDKNMAKSPVSGKWHNVFKKFQEWNKAGSSSPQGGLSHANKDQTLHSLEEEIAKLRGAIIQLKNRKKLTKKDEMILNDLQDQLKMRVAQKDRYMNGKATTTEESNTEDDYNN